MNSVDILRKQLNQFHSGTRLKTKTGIDFTINKITTSHIYIDLNPIQSISINNLEKAVKYLQNGGALSGPSDYRLSIADDRPAYAWAILHYLAYC